MNYFNMQWHLTERCNLRCKHCYQETLAKEMSKEDYLRVLDQYDVLLENIRKASNRSDIRGMITVTGGEPLVFPFFYDIIREIKNRGHEFAVLTNGTLITEDTIEKFLELKPSYVQVSIDGTKEIHDSIRGKGNFDKATEGLRLLVKKHIPCCISFTAHKQNYKCFYDVAVIGAKLGVDYIWSDRLIPTGSGADVQMMSNEEYREFLKIMMTAKIDLSGYIYVKMKRALQFLASGEPIYQCQAGKMLIVVMPDGTVYPCRRMPINLGNLKTTPLSELYFSHPIMKDLRNEDKFIPSKCNGCKFKTRCGGGLKCLSYALTNKINEKDVNCWLGKQ